MADAIPILEIGVILLGAALIGFGFRKLGLPAVVGYLLAGLFIGPFTPGYVADRHQIQVLADFGVVLLLFEVGIELDLRALRREPLGILVAVPAQVAFVTLAGTAAFVALGSGVLGAVTLGLAVALSSSIVVVNITRSRKRTTDEVTARALLVWSVLQDVVTLVAATILTVLLAPGEAGGGAARVRQGGRLRGFRGCCAGPRRAASSASSARRAGHFPRRRGLGGPRHRRHRRGLVRGATRTRRVRRGSLPLGSR